IRLCVICVCRFLSFSFFFNDTATTEIYTLSLHDALPICVRPDGSASVRSSCARCRSEGRSWRPSRRRPARPRTVWPEGARTSFRSEEHTSELQSRENLVCRLLLEKKKKKLIKHDVISHDI